MKVSRSRRSHSKSPQSTKRASFEALESRQLLTAAVWTGAGSNSLFTNAANWQGGVAPTSGQDVDFPASASQTTVTVNANVTVGALEFDAAYTLSSSAGTSDSLTINGAVSVTAGVPIINSPIVLTSNATWLVDDTSGLQTNGVISDGGGAFGIDKEGNGALGLAGTGETYTGTTIVGGGVLIDTAPLASPINATSGNTFYGNTSVNSLVGTSGTIEPANFDANTDTSTPATLTVSHGINFDSPSDTTLAFDIDGPTNSSNFNVTGGTIALNSAPLSTTIVDGYTPAPGDVITLIHNNTGQPITGTFLNLPQGATTTIGGTTYTISYTGGSDGRDVTLTAPGTAANPHIVSNTGSTSTHGRTVALSCVGADSTKGGAAGLTYTWTLVHRPSGAKVPTYSANGTNAASNVTVRLFKNGTYIFQCTVKDESGNTATADTTVVVGQKATALSLAPSKAKIAPKHHEQYTATVLDQFGHTDSAAQAIAYSVPSGGATINSAGLLTAGKKAAKITIEAKDGTLAAIVNATIT